MFNIFDAILNVYNEILITEHFIDSGREFYKTCIKL